MNHNSRIYVAGHRGLVGSAIVRRLRQESCEMLSAEVVGFEGEIVRDLGKPDGMPRKLMSSARLRATGWAPRIPLRDGLSATYAWYLENIATTRA